MRNAGAALILITAAAAAEPVTIAALGDSLTQGYGLPPEDGLVPQLDAWLDTAGIDARIINAGVSGDTTAGGLARAEWTLTDEVDALIVALGGNDVLRGIAPRTARANLEGILRVAAAAEVPVLLVGIDVPGNYGAEYEAEFEAIYPDLAEEFGTDLMPDMLAPITSRGPLDEVLRDYVQPDGLHPNAQGVRLIVEALGPRVADLVARAGGG